MIKEDVLIQYSDSSMVRIHKPFMSYSQIMRFTTSNATGNSFLTGQETIFGS